MEKHQATIALLTETQQRINHPLPGLGAPFMIDGEGKETTGIAIVYPTTKAITISVATERIIEATLPNSIHIIGAYGPNETTILAKKLTFWEQLNRTASNAIQHHDIVVIIGDLNAGQEPLQCKKPTGGPNYDRLTHLMANLEFKWLETPPTWRSAASRTAERTLDRCLIHCAAPYEATTTINWEDRLSDHAALYASIVFTSINRNIGRPYNKLRHVASNIDQTWHQYKPRLQQLKPTTTDNTDQEETNQLTNFWTLRRNQETAQQQKLVIINTQGEELKLEQAVQDVAEVLKNLWFKHTPTTTALPNTTTIQQPSLPPTIEEIKAAITALKRDTAIGCDGISTNAIKDNPEAPRIYLSLLNDIWNTIQMPQEWKDMRVKPIPKSQHRATAQNTRPITCLSTSTKIMNTIIAKRGENNYNSALHLSQHAYRKEKSIWTAKEELLNTIKSLEGCCITILDMSKAFDRINRTTLEQALNLWNLPATEHQLILEQYRQSMVHIELHGKRAPPFQHSTGIRQGCVLSGMLFNLVVSIIIHNVEANYNSRFYKIISYSDDIVLVTKEKLTTQVMLKTIETQLEVTGLSLNREKTKSFSFGQQSTQLETFEWLGTIFSTNLTWNNEIATRIQKAKAASGNIQQLCRSHNLKLHKDCIINIVQALVLPHLKNSLDIVQPSKEQQNQVINALTASIMENTQLSEDQALQHATELLLSNSTPKSTTTKRKIFQSKDKPPLPAAPLQSPSDKEIARRKALSAQLQEERRHCNICNPPKYFKDINAHRARTHNLEPLPRLQIFCPECNRNIDSGQYYKHICILTPQPTANSSTSSSSFTPPTTLPMDACPYCQSKYTQRGLAQHIVKCKAKPHVTP